MALNGTVHIEWWTGKMTKRSDIGLIWGTNPKFVKRDKEIRRKNDSEVVNISAKIRTWNLPDTAPYYEFHENLFANSLIKRGHKHTSSQTVRHDAAIHCLSLRRSQEKSQGSLRNYQPSSCCTYFITGTWHAFRLYRIIVSVASFNILSFGP